MKARQLIACVVMLLVSAGVHAEGGKERGSVGQGNINQDQVRVVVPPTQWTSTTTSTSQTVTDTSLLGKMNELLLFLKSPR